eukprot:9150501-Alexandrium_andersonii.AAC.1
MCVVACRWPKVGEQKAVIEKLESDLISRPGDACCEWVVVAIAIGLCAHNGVAIAFGRCDL